MQCAVHARERKLTRDSSTNRTAPLATNDIHQSPCLTLPNSPLAAPPLLAHHLLASLAPRPLLLRPVAVYLAPAQEMLQQHHHHHHHRQHLHFSVRQQHPAQRTSLYSEAQLQDSLVEVASALVTLLQTQVQVEALVYLAVQETLRQILVAAVLVAFPLV